MTINYKYIYSKYAEDLAKQLEEALATEWEPYGHPLTDQLGYITQMLKRKSLDSMPVKGYGIVIGMTPAEFIQSMNEALEKGWQPHGSAIVRNVHYKDGKPDQFEAIQVMVRGQESIDLEFRQAEQQMREINEALQKLQEKQNSTLEVGLTEC